MGFQTISVYIEYGLIYIMDIATTRTGLQSRQVNPHPGKSILDRDQAG